MELIPHRSWYTYNDSDTSLNIRRNVSKLIVVSPNTLIALAGFSYNPLNSDIFATQGFVLLNHSQLRWLIPNGISTTSVLYRFVIHRSKYLEEQYAL